MERVNNSARLKRDGYFALISSLVFLALALPIDERKERSVRYREGRSAGGIPASGVPDRQGNVGEYAGD